jgi:hypothetical protein
MSEGKILFFHIISVVLAQHGKPVFLARGGDAK